MESTNTPAEKDRINEKALVTFSGSQSRAIHTRVDAWIALFVDSDFYTRSLVDPSYTRAKAFLDFLYKTVPSEVSQLLTEELISLIMHVQKNYYRFF